MFKQISLNIKALRKSAKLSQSDLADSLHITRQQVANYEKGTTSIPFANIVKMSEIFNISIDTLVKQDFNALEDDSKLDIRTNTEIDDLQTIINTEALTGLIHKLVDERIKSKLANVEDLLYKMLAIIKTKQAKDTIVEELQSLDDQIKDTLGH